MTYRSDIEDLLGEADPPPKRKRGRPVADHRQKLVLAQAQLAEIRAAKLRGDLVPAVAVEAEWASILADLRQQILAIPARVGATLALPRETVAALDAEIRAVLTALAAQEGAPEVRRVRTA